jgi:transcriptional regulator with XRE-family HTH domain
MARRKKIIKTTNKEFDTFLRKVGEKMLEKRIENGYSSYEQFAYEHEIGRSQYGKYERGTEDMRLSSLYKILKSLGYTFEDFFKGLK